MHFDTHIESTKFGGDVTVTGYLSYVGEDDTFTVYVAKSNGYPDDQGSIREAISKVNTELRTEANRLSRVNKANGTVPVYLPEFNVVESFSTA